IIKHKNIYFLISLLVIIPGIISLFLFGLRLSIDFTGGSRMALVFPEAVTTEKMNTVRQVFSQKNIQVATIQPSGNTIILRTTPITETQNRELRTTLNK